MAAPSIVLAGRYRLAGRIAVGGVGEVWRAADTALARPVAVKLLRAEFAGHQETRARFRAEARHAGALSHPGIARVYDYGDDDPPYLVMELVDGPSLAEILASGPLQAARTMRVVAEAAAGLAAAHAAGLVHRDIKPANLLISQGGQVKITDFGIAHAAGSAPLTRTGTVLGTPAYLAPERVAGASGAPAADLYALGVVAYECLAGARPFTGDQFAVAAAHRDRPLPPLPADVPEAVAALVTRLTEKEPAARPASAAEVAQRAGWLARAITDEPAAAPAGAPRPAPGQLPANAGGVTRGDWPAADEPAGEVPDRRSPGRPVRGPRRAWPARMVVLAMAVAVLAAGTAGWLLAAVFAARPPVHPAAVRAGSYPGGPGAAGARPGRAQGRSARSEAPAHAVTVDRAALVGQPVAAVRARLRGLGFQVRVHWRRQAWRTPGTVLGLDPGGALPPDSVVVLTGTARPSLPGHDQGGQRQHGGGGDGHPHGSGHQRSSAAGDS